MDNKTAYLLNNTLGEELFSSNASGEPFGGGENHTTPNHTILEGGFLSGRNPFAFIPSMPLPTFIIQLVVIVCMSRIVKLVLSPFKQPCKFHSYKHDFTYNLSKYDAFLFAAVIAEIISGILLGPTILGQIPHFTTTIFPSASLPFLNLMSNFGLVLFLFLVGLELDPVMLRKSIKKSFAISLAGMALPFFLGCGSSYILFEFIEPESHRQNSFTSYLLFLGVAMAITAFPVLARILTELNLLKTKVGSITISAAAVDDATSWCLLALVISIINANSNLTALYVFLMGLSYSAFLILIIRPIFIGCLRLCGVFSQDTPSPTSMFFALMLVFISAFITDAIGIHAIFGGFLAGIIMPHERGFAYHITEKLEDVVQILFLPLYFALSGLKTKIGTLDDPLSWGVVCIVIFAACSGKIIGCTLAARTTKLSWRESFTVGTLMNCKGLVELIVLNLGYDSGVITDKTFAIMVIMALVTTFITVPLVSFIYPPEYHEGIDEKDTEKKRKEPGLLVSVNRIEQVGPILSVVNLLQMKLNQQKVQHDQRKGSNSSNFSGDNHLNQQQGPLGGQKKMKQSISSLADYLNFGKGSAKTPPGVIISVLRLIELTERDSSVMLSANQAALQNDPITKLLKTFCEVTNKANQVEGVVKVVTMQMFGRVLAQVGEKLNARYILLPWSGSGSMVEDKGGNVGGIMRPVSVMASARRRQSIHTAQQHSSFFMDLLQEAERQTVVIFVDRGGAVVPVQVGEEDVRREIGREVWGRGKQIFLPFFGGKDDREALDIVMGLEGARKWRIQVVRFRVGKRREIGEDLGNGRDTEVEPRENGEEVGIEIESEDDRVLGKWFGEGKMGGKRLVGGEREDNILEEVEEEEGNVQYSEVESPNPVGKALQYLVHLGGQDLVVVGRNAGERIGEEMGLGIHFRNEDQERKRVLGDLAEAVMLCHCNASLLVVRGGDKEL